VVRNLSALIVLCLCALNAWSTEVKLSGDDIRALLADHVMAGEADGRSWEQTFQKGGVTLYSTGGAHSQGFWKVRGDQYCSQWPPSETWSCYDMARDGATYVFISASAQRTVAKLLK
jgi:hypothetical protein